MNASQTAQLAALVSSTVKDRTLFRYVAKGAKFRFPNSIVPLLKTGRTAYRELPCPGLSDSNRRYQTGLNVIVVEIK